MEHVNIWDMCFSLAWEAFIEGSIPIGAVIVDERMNILVTGRNRIYRDAADSLPGKISHAEMNALYKFNQSQIYPPNPRTCTLFSTMEPCSMCLGATIFSNIRTIFYAAEDSYAGGIHENRLPQYIERRLSARNTPPTHYDSIQIVLQTVYLLEKSAQSIVKKNDSLDLWSIRYPRAVELGKQFFKENILRDLANHGASFAYVKSIIISHLERG